MATFSVRFLGCKVSHTDAHEIRERLLLDGHSESATSGDDRSREHVLRDQRGRSKSRQAASRAARTHDRVYVTGCAANLAGDAFQGLPANVTVVARPSEQTPSFIAGDVGAIGCVQSDARLDRVRAFVKVQDGCSFSCNFCVIPLVRGSSRSRRAAAVLSEIRRRVEQGHREVVLDRHQSRLLPRSRGGLHARTARAGGSPDTRSGAATPVVDRDQPRRRRTGAHPS